MHLTQDLLPLCVYRTIDHNLQPFSPFISTHQLLILDFFSLPKHNVGSKSRSGWPEDRSRSVSLHRRCLCIASSRVWLCVHMSVFVLTTACVNLEAGYNQVVPSGGNISLFCLIYETENEKLCNTCEDHFQPTAFDVSCLPEKYNTTQNWICAVCYLLTLTFSHIGYGGD